MLFNRVHSNRPLNASALSETGNDPVRFTCFATGFGAEMGAFKINQPPKIPTEENDFEELFQ